MSDLRFGTRLVHFDAAPGDPHRPVTTPIYQTTTFSQQSALNPGEFDYSRSGNPTRSVLEQQIARLEGAERAFSFSSGMAAISAVCRLVGCGGEILAGDDLYGGSYRLLSRILKRYGVIVRYVDTTDLETLQHEIGPQTKLVLVETPTNPLQRITDLRRVADLCHAHGAVLAVDNSLLSPVLQRPLELGADIVIHSATKFLGGHSDVSAGVVAVNDPELIEELYLVQNGEGTALSPMDSWLLLRGTKTLKLRVRQQQENARHIADLLTAHPAVDRVFWPGLTSHPGHTLHRSQSSGPGSVISFTTGSLADSAAVVDATRLFHTCVSFGSVGSSISVPCRMSHASIPVGVRRSRQLPEDLVRVSVGIEEPEDLVADMERALDAVRPSFAVPSALNDVGRTAANSGALRAK